MKDIKTGWKEIGATIIISLLLLIAGDVQSVYGMWASFPLFVVWVLVFRYFFKLRHD